MTRQLAMHLNRCRFKEHSSVRHVVHKDGHDGRDVRLEVVQAVNEDVACRVFRDAVVVLDPFGVLHVVPLHLGFAHVVHHVVEPRAAVVHLKLDGAVAAVQHVECPVVLADLGHLPAAHAVVVQAKHVDVRRKSLVRGPGALVEVVLVHRQLVLDDALQLAHQQRPNERASHLSPVVAGARHHQGKSLFHDVVDERARVAPHELDPLAHHFVVVLARNLVARLPLVAQPKVTLLFVTKHADQEDFLGLDRNAGNVTKQPVGDEVRQLPISRPRFGHVLPRHLDHDAVRVSVNDHVAFVLDGLFGVVYHAPPYGRDGRRDVGDGYLALFHPKKPVPTCVEWIKMEAQRARKCANAQITKGAN